MARKKEKHAGEHGNGTCWCGECDCETQEECLDPRSKCFCRTKPNHCCAKPHGDDGPNLLAVQEQHERELVPA